MRVLFAIVMKRWTMKQGKKRGDTCPRESGDEKEGERSAKYVGVGAGGRGKKKFGVLVFLLASRV